MLRKNFYLLAWFDLVLGLWVAARATRAERWGYWAVVGYGASLLLSGVFTRIAAIVGGGAARIAWSVRAILYLIGASSAGYVLLMPIWSNEKAEREDLAFMVGGLVFLAANTGLSIWLCRRPGIAAPAASE